MAFDTQHAGGSLGRTAGGRGMVMVTKLDQNAFRTLTTIVADSPERIRPCDVDRLFLAAKGIYAPAEFYSFVAWLYLRAGVGIHSEIEDWLAGDGGAQLDFREDTFSITFRDRAVFNMVVAESVTSPLVVDVGYADMTINLEGIETE